MSERTVLRSMSGGEVCFFLWEDAEDLDRMNQTMTRLQKMTEDEYSSFLRVLFGLSSPSPVPQNPDGLEAGFGKIEWISESLNESQKEAIKFALASREVALIHGPPGVSLSLAHYS